MRTTSPSKRWQFLLLAAAVWVLMPVVEAITDLLFISTPHKSVADSPAVAAMQLVQFVIFLAVLLPLYVGFIWLVWRHYPGSVGLFTFNRSHPLRSSALWAFFGAASLAALTNAFFVRSAWEVPWALHNFMVVYFLLSCNVALASGKRTPAHP